MTLKDRYKDKDDREINQLNSVLPLYIYKVLKCRTDDEHHMTQAELIRILQGEPYNIKLSRRAISRHIHTLEIVETGVRAGSYRGVWYSKEDDRLFKNIA